MSIPLRFLNMTLLVIAAFSLTTNCRQVSRANQLTLFDLQSSRTIADTQAIEALEKARLVLVGEHHTDPAHHAAQLQVIRSLEERKVPLAIGLEMFRKDQQEALQHWVSGDIDEKKFEKIYLDNWNYPWPLYRDIFIYARENNIPIVGLNVSRGITRQVAKQGFASLSDEQRGELEGVTCNVTREYRDFIRNAYGAHGHGDMNFVHFCEAQLVWDTAMAINAVNYLKTHANRVMVLLAGSAHARKMGIPYRVKERASIPMAVLLPRTTDIFEPDTLTPADADYIIMPTQ